MRRILVLASLLAFSGGAAADTRKGYEAYTGGDFKTAVQEFRASALQGDALAMFYLGECYYNGRGTVQDYSEAIKWYKQSADQNDARAQASLGFLYYTGKGVAQDLTEAVKLFQKAAAQNEASAYSSLAWAYYQGKGTQQDAVMAYMWSNLAASQLSGEEGERVGKVRDFIGSKLAPDQLAKAQDLARNWRPKK